MYPHQFMHERESVDEQHAPERDQGISQRRLPQRSRVCVLLVLALFGLYVLATGPGTGKGDTLSQQPASPGHASVQAGRATGPGARPTPGLGAGPASGEKTGAHTPAALCLNPLDVTCWLQSAAQWVAQQLMNALQPVIGAIMNSPLNILTQTPPADTYQNPTVITWSHGFLAAVDLALASLIVIGGDHAPGGRPLGPPPAQPAGVLPRLLPAFRAPHVHLY